MVARGLGRDSFGFGGLPAEPSFPRSRISRALCRTLAAGEAGREEGRLCCPAANAAEMATVGGWNLVQLANPSSLKIEVMVLTSAPLAVLCTVHPNTVWTLQAQGAIQSVAVRLEGACAEKRAIHGGAGGGGKGNRPLHILRDRDPGRPGLSGWTWRAMPCLPRIKKRYALGDVPVKIWTGRQVCRRCA